MFVCNKKKAKLEAKEHGGLVITQSLFPFFFKQWEKYCLSYLLTSVLRLQRISDHFALETKELAQ